MKEKILIIILCVMFIPFFANAKDKCSVISGTGDKIGDEIKCGTESFYIVSNNDDTVSMLAKYNLFVGDKIDYFDLEETQTVDDFSKAENLCNSEAEQRGYNAYYTYPMAVDPNSYPSFDVKGCRVYEKIEYDKVVQDERAVGTKLVNGKSVLPLYGIVYMNPNWGYESMVDGDYYDFDYDRKGDLKISTTPFEKYLDGYKEELKRQNIEVQDVSFIHLSRTLELLEAISGKEVEVELEYPGNMYDWDQEQYEFFYGKMDVKDFLGEQYKWIYDITYWLGSGFIGDESTNTEDFHNDYFMSNEGFLCAIGRGECTYFMYPIGQGIRPLVIIPKSEIKKTIVNPETGNKVALVTILLIISASLGFYFHKNKNNA